MVLNTAGYVPIFDFGAPRIVTGKAKEVISGGEFVFASGGDNVVSSGPNSYAAGDMEFATDASGGQFNGVAIANVASGATMRVALDGVIIATASNTVTAGFPVMTDGVNSVANTGSLTMTATSQYHKVGRALTAAASGGHCLVHIGD
jgi:hypothetical protein